MDKHKIDSHKLHLHPERVLSWKNALVWEKAKQVYPLYVEISATGSCNHRCRFCAVDFMEYPDISLDETLLKSRISEMALLGVKSVMFAGEGEPLLHKQIASITAYTKQSGIDVAFTTNGTALTEKFCDEALGFVSWLKVSINAGTAATYASIHNAPEKHFTLVLKNIAKAVEIKKQRGYGCSIGAQMVLLPENMHEIELLAQEIRTTGADYVVFKPHSQHPLSHVQRYKNITYAYAEIDWDALEQKFQEQSTKEFKIILRRNTIKKLEDDEHYNRCLSVPFFWAYITSRGDVYSCSMFLGDDRFLLGSIYTENFREIWEGERRKRNWEFMRKFDVSTCRKNCRMDECNRFLNDIKNPPPHSNFI